MSNTKQILNWFSFIIIGGVLGVLVSLSLSNLNKKVEIKEKVTIIKNDTTLVRRIKDLENENEVLREELQIKESEISYWGRKYDDLKHKRND
jgi:uncharacterized membrane protein YgaE (UPF0421/DUF939 family)